MYRAIVELRSLHQKDKKRVETLGRGEYLHMDIVLGTYTRPLSGEGVPRGKLTYLPRDSISRRHPVARVQTILIGSLFNRGGVRRVPCTKDNPDLEVISSFLPQVLIT